MSDIAELKERAQNMKLIHSGFVVSFHNSHSPDAFEYSLFHDNDWNKPPVLAFTHLKGSQERQGLYAIATELVQAVEMEISNILIENNSQNASIWEKIKGTADFGKEYHNTQHAISWLVLPEFEGAMLYKYLTHKEEINEIKNFVKDEFEVLLDNATDAFEKYQAERLGKAHSLSERKGKNSSIAKFVNDLIEYSSQNERIKRQNSKQFLKACDEIPVLLQVPQYNNTFELSKLTGLNSDNTNLVEIANPVTLKAVKNSLNLDIEAKEQSNDFLSTRDKLSKDINNAYKKAVNQSKSMSSGPSR